MIENEAPILPINEIPQTDNQNIAEQTKPRKANSRLFVLLFILCLVSMGSGFYYLKSKDYQIPQSNISLATPVATSSATATATTTPSAEPSTSPNTAIVKEDDLSPKGQLSGKLAFIRDDNLWWFTKNEVKQLTLDAIPVKIPYWDGLPKLWYSNPEISPDGTKIAFLRNTNTDSRAIMVGDINGENIKQIVSDVEWTMPIIQWSSDSKQIYYPSEGTLEKIIIKSVNVATQQKQEYGQFDMLTGCGGGSSDPGDHLSAAEEIISVGGGVQVFNLSPQNDFVIHTVDCGGVGLGMFDLSTKQDRRIDDKASKAVISPDGKSIAAILGKSILVFDTTGKIQKTFSVSDIPLVLVWDAEGKTIYYSSSKLLKTLDLEDKVALEVTGSSPTSYQVNTSSLWKLTLDSGKNEKMMDFEAHHIKPIYASSQKLFFVIVENSNALFDYVSQQKTQDNMYKYYPKVKLAEVDLSSLSSTVIITKVQQSSFQP